MSLKKNPYTSWPKGLSKRIGLLDLQPEEFEQKYDVEFTETSDSFDYMKSAIIELETGEQYAIVQFRGSKHLGLEIWTFEMEENGIE